VRTILEGLNDEQQKAVKQVEGPVLIVAGAGSGKTRVLTSRVAYILASGVSASRILALTFTKKAATEMKERISLMVGSENARRLVMGTFHAVFVRFLREYADSLGYPQDFTIYDTADSQSAMKACIRELELDEKMYKPRDVLSRISMAKNNLMTVSAYCQNVQLHQRDSQSKHPQIGALYALYQKKLKQSGVMDFDDILVNMNILLRDNHDARQAISDRFSYILVDEYQDTNYAQYLIIKKLSELHRNLCVVGDDSQSIYAFRGAKIENILNFRKDYPEYKLFRLEQNYRSTRNIVDAANSLIAKNENRIPKECFSQGETGDKIRLLSSYSETEEAVQLTSEILYRMREDHAAYRDFAILYRTNAQSRAIEDALRRKNIPYVVYSGNAFFDRAEIKDMMAYFKLVVNPLDNESFKRVVNLPARGIGATSLSALNECARAHECSLFNAVNQADTELYALKASAREKLLSFCKLIDSLAIAARGEDAYRMARRIADESGLYAMYKADTSIEGQARTANLDELFNSVQLFIQEQTGQEGEPETQARVLLSDYLENVSLLSNVDVNDDDNNKVGLMTVHSAKGLEFPYVFVAGMEENLFPSASMLVSQRDLEEERRLFYVAITRAKKVLLLSYASSRMRNGQSEYNNPSRFIKEIDSRYIENPISTDEGRVMRPSPTRASFTSSSSYRPRQKDSFAPAHLRRDPSAAMPIQRQPVLPKPQLVDDNFQAVPMTELFVGERIEHNRFGAGTIQSLTGTAPEMKASVDFDKYGTKLLLLKYAKMRPLKR